jgi:hypothetical protein
MSDNPTNPDDPEGHRSGELHSMLGLLAWMLGGTLQGGIVGILTLVLCAFVLPMRLGTIAVWSIYLAAFVVGFVAFGYELQALDRALSKRRRRRATVKGDMPYGSEKRQEE